MKVFKVGVRVLPRPEVLDTQGRAVESTLRTQQFKVEQCRVGRYIEVRVPAQDTESALQEVRRMAEFVLYNPLIETFQLEVVPA
jgi:phosphoribosylformylglycinamidine synthase subunit PurS